MVGLRIPIRVHMVTWLPVPAVLLVLCASGVACLGLNRRGMVLRSHPDVPSKLCAQIRPQAYLKVF